MIHVKSLDRRPPVRDLHFIIDLQRLQTELLHPDRIVFFFRQFIDDRRRQPFLDPVFILLLVPDVINTSVYIFYITFFFQIRYTPFRSAYSDICSNPFSLMVSTKDASPFFTILPPSMTWVTSTFKDSRILVLCVMIRRLPLHFS